MDVSLVGAMSGVLGSLIGGSATVATTWVSQRTATSRELVRDEMHKREALYGEFVAECARILMDAFEHSLDKPERLLPAYALINRIRLSASQAVLAEAEHLLRRITEQYFSDKLTLDDLRRIALSGDGDPLKAFGEACRAELKSLRAQV
jgi:hypothetical protein